MSCVLRVLASMCLFVLLAPVSAYGAIIPVPPQTVIRLYPELPILQSTNRMGTTVNLVVAKDVFVDDVMIIAAGARATARVKRSLNKSYGGVPAQIDIILDEVYAVDGRKIPLNGRHQVRGIQNKLAGGISLLCCPFFVAIKGGDAEIPAGTLIRATTARHAEIEVPFILGSLLNSYGADLDERMFGPKESPPRHRLLGTVYAHGQSSADHGEVTFDSLGNSISAQLDSLGGDIVVKMLSGMTDLRDGKGISKWILGIAARTVGTAIDTLRDCDNCQVDWVPPDLDDAGFSEATADSVSRLAFSISRLCLADLGYYLLDAAKADAELTGGFRLGSKTPQDPLRTLALQVTARKGQLDPSGPAVINAFHARLHWKVSDSQFWEKQFSWEDPESKFSFTSGEGALETRTTFTGLYGTVPHHGPAPDSDGDGVPDSRDKEPQSLSGAEVDSQTGISLDDDGDGVPNGIDRDPHTRLGRMVDEWGVPYDQDHDGIDDQDDLCSDTPADHAVDETGCSIRIDSTIVKSLVDEGMFREHIYFGFGDAEILSASFPRLDAIAVALADLPALLFWIDGHCDDVGTDEVNDQLSLARARAVINYLVRSTSRMSRRQFSARGFGEKQPIAAGTDDVSRALNRRVEFVLQNREAAVKKIIRSRFLRRGESLPDSLNTTPSVPDSLEVFPTGGK